MKMSYPARSNIQESRRMRKSNWIIAAVLLLASVAFLWIWHALQFDLVDNPSILW